MRIQAKIMIALVFAAISATATATDIWYEDNNLGRPDGIPQDFAEKFHQPETFSQASGYIYAYMVRANVLGVMDDEFLANLFRPYLNKNHIKLAIDATGATWTQMEGWQKIAPREIRLLERLKRLGIQVDYISLQSVLSKPLVVNGATMDYPLAWRIEDAISYAKAASAIYPQVQIGIIDALPSHGEEYRQPYRMLKDAFAQEKIVLSYIHLDMPFDIPKTHWHGITWQQIRNVESYVEDDLGLRFGLIVTSSAGGTISSKTFHERVLATMECYSGAGGTPGDLIIASWFPYPKTTIPETATGNDYPAMRTVLEFGRQLVRIGNMGVQATDQPAWRAMCTTP